MRSQNMSKLMPLIVVIIFVVALAACGSGSSGTGVSPLYNRGDLISVSPVKTVGVSGVNAMVTFVNSQSPVPLSSGAVPLYSVNYYLVTYATVNPAGSPTTASGLLLVPSKGANSTSPLLSMQHGTMIWGMDAPSYSDGTTLGTSSEAQMGFIEASLGYVVMMPDYLGYGASWSIFHPYIQASTLASATIDMIRASKKFLSQGNTATNGQLFLAGYSEGGYATLAAQKEMEASLASEFTITASEPGSGPYDLTHTASAIAGSANLAGVTDPIVLAFLFKAYDVYYDNPNQLASYFTSGTVLNCVNADFKGTPIYGVDPYFGTFDGCIGGTTVTANILNPTFINNFNTGGEAALKANLALNDIYNWSPKAKTRLFYSATDDFVPPISTINAYNAMVANGAAQVQTAQCTGVTPATHMNCIIPYMNDTVAYFGTLANNL